MAAKRRAHSAPELVTTLREHAQRLLRWPNVTSVGVGYQATNGKRTNTLCIQISVRAKYTPEELAKLGLKPLPKSIPDAAGRRIPVDIIERSYRLSHQIIAEPVGTPFPTPPHPLSSPPGAPRGSPPDPRLVRRSRLPTIMPGVSVSNVTGIAGTIGAIVFDNATGVPCALSATHVLGLPATAPGIAADRVVQPGRNDDADIAKTTLGRVLRSHVGLAGDCAITSIETRLHTRVPFELSVTPARIAQAEPGDPVIMSARTSGITRGVVSRIGVVISHDYGPPLGVRDIGAFEIEPEPGATLPVSKGGDSGGLWLIRNGQDATDIAVGLHFAIDEPLDDRPATALACNIHSVLEVMDVSLSPK